MKYRNFGTKIVSLAVVVICLLLTNNYLVQANEKKETAIAAQQELITEQKAQAAAEAKAQGVETTQLYTDGTYEGSAAGFGGTITVRVTLQSDQLTDIEIASAAKEDAAYLDSAVKIIDKILQANSADVDTISGATYSSTGIKNAVILALEEARR